jgi:hypothetical protein
MPFLNDILARFGNQAPSPEQPFYRYSASFVPPIALLALLLLSLGSDLFSGQVIGSTHLDNDLGYFISLRKFAFYGDTGFPFWNPHLMCGVPLIAEIQSGMFYPPNLIFRVLPLPLAINWSLIIHLYLLALGTYFFGRQLHLSRAGAMIAASVFCFCGPVFIRLFAGHHTDLYTIAWIPAVFLCVDKIGRHATWRKFIFLAVLFCLQFLAGHPQYLYYTIIFSWFYFIWATRPLLKRKLYRSWGFGHVGFVLSLCVAGLIALPQLLPVFEMLSLSPRKSLEFSDVAWFSFPPQNLLTFFMPLFYGDGVEIPYWGLFNLWEMCAFCGTIPLMLSAFAIKDVKTTTHSVFFFLLAAFAIIMALGKHTPLFKLAYYVLPGLDMFRGHSKMHLFYCFAVALLAGTGYDAQKRSLEFKSRRFVWLLTAALVALFILLMVIPYTRLLEAPVTHYLQHLQKDPRSYLPTPGADNTEFLAAVLKQIAMSWRYFLVNLWFGLLLIILMLRFGSRLLLQTAMILAVLTDLFIFGNTFVASVDMRHWDLKPEVMQFIARDNEPSRSAVITTFGPRYGITSPLQQLGGDYPYVLNRYSRLYNLANEGKPTASMKITNIRRISPVFNLFSLKYLVLNSDRQLDIPGFYRVYNDDVLAVLENEYARKRVYIPQNIKIVDEEDEALRGVFELPSIRGEQLIIERDSVAGISFAYESLLHGADRDETVDIIHYSPNTIKLQAQLNADAWIILTDTYYPGWKAAIDGESEVPIVPGNYAFRAIYVPKGTHEIILQYRPRFFIVCVAISLITLLGATAAATREL